MQQILAIISGVVLLSPIAAVGQQVGPYPSTPGPTRLPAVAPLQNAIYVEPIPIMSAPATRPVQAAQVVVPVPDPTSEALPTPQPAGGRLTLADLESMAVANNPSVARAAALVEAARGNHIQVGLPFNPTFGYEGQQIGSRGLAEQDGAFVSQEIVRGGKLRLNRQIAAQEWSRAEQELAAQQQRVLTDVRIAYFDVVIAERQEKLTNELQGIAADVLKLAQALKKGGEFGSVEVIQSQMELEKAAMEVQDSVFRRQSAWRNLSTTVGDPNLPLQSLDDGVTADLPAEDYEFDSTLERLLSASPEVAAAMSNVERARWAVQRAFAERTPNITVQGLVNWRDNGIGGRSDGALTVGVPLPFWNRNQGGIIQAQSQAAAAERELDQMQLSLRNRLAPVFERYQAARNQVAKYHDRMQDGETIPGILTLSERSLDMTRRLFRVAGEVPYRDVLTVQRTYSQIKLNYLNSLRQLRIAEAEIDGLLLSGSLNTR